MSNIEHARRFSFKIFCDPKSVPNELALFVPVFHRWIQQDMLADELAIDVVDSRHVPKGPSVMLGCHCGHYVIDQEGGETGRAYNNTRESDGPLAERLRRALVAVLRAATLLSAEASLGGLKFLPNRLRFQIHDRLHELAPDTGVAAREACGEDQQHRAHDLGREWVPDAGGM